MRRRGLTLAETLLTLFLLGLILSIAADLMRRGRNLASFYRQKSDLQHASWTLQRVAVQLQSASRIVLPVLNGQADRLEFQRVASDLSNRLPTTLGAHPAPSPPANPVWDPLAAAYLESVSIYRVDPGDLLFSTPADEAVLTQQLSRFRCRSQGRLLELEAAVRVRGQEQVVQVRQWVGAGVQW